MRAVLKRNKYHIFFPTSITLQLHFVSYNVKYGGIENSLNETDGLAVLGVLIEVCSFLKVRSVIHPAPLTTQGALRD